MSFEKPVFKTMILIINLFCDTLITRNRLNNTRSYKFIKFNYLKMCLNSE